MQMWTEPSNALPAAVTAEHTHFQTNQMHIDDVICTLQAGACIASMTSQPTQSHLRRAKTS